MAEKKIGRPGASMPRDARGADIAAKNTVALRVAEAMGLLSGPKSMHFNAKIQPALFQAAAQRLGTTSPAAVISAALACLATEDELGPWLARNWGVLSDIPADILDQIDI